MIGIRTPWTLADERVWDRTHRLARWPVMLTGLAIVLPRSPRRKRSCSSSPSRSCSWSAPASFCCRICCGAAATRNAWDHERAVGEARTYRCAVACPRLGTAEGGGRVRPQRSFCNDSEAPPQRPPPPRLAWSPSPTSRGRRKRLSFSWRDFARAVRSTVSKSLPRDECGAFFLSSLRHAAKGKRNADRRCVSTSARRPQRRPLPRP